jgi:hypothetical protein
MVNQYPGFRSIFDATCGIVFLGTPHMTSQGDEKWENCRLILKSNRKDVPKQCLSADDISKLASVCQQFEDVNLQVPVLSVYEATETKVRENLLQSLRGNLRNKIVSV